MDKKKVIKGSWEDVIKASVKDNPKPKKKKKDENNAERGRSKKV